MAPSSEGPGNGNGHNTLGGSAIPVNTVNFSPGVRTSPERGRHRKNHVLSPARGARTPQGVGKGPAPTGAMRRNFPRTVSLPRATATTTFSPRTVVRAPHGRGEGVIMSKRRGGLGDTASTTRRASNSGNFGSLGTRHPPQCQP